MEERKPSNNSTYIVALEKRKYPRKKSSISKDTKTFPPFVNSLNNHLISTSRQDW